jgi:hypothetical protein
VNVWTSTKKINARDSLNLMERLDDLVREKMPQNANPTYWMPCCEESPYRDYMDKLGFTKVGATTMFQKTLASFNPVSPKTAEDVAQLTRKAQQDGIDRRNAAKEDAEKIVQFGKEPESVEQLEPEPATT